MSNCEEKMCAKELSEMQLYDSFMDTMYFFKELVCYDIL
jgi:hypothetical protein